MTKHPLSKREAEILCKKFQTLVGERLNFGGSFMPIRHVAVAPYSDTDRYIFILEYTNSGDVALALNIYEGDLYDVILMAETLSEKKYIRYKSLAQYLEEKDRQN